MATLAKFLSKKLGSYKGYTFDSVVEDAFGYGMVGLKLTRGNEEVVFWVQSDEEGNGTGFIEAEEVR